MLVQATPCIFVLFGTNCQCATPPKRYQGKYGNPLGKQARHRTVLAYAVLCCAMLCHAVLLCCVCWVCCAVPMSFCAVLCCAMPCHFLLCCVLSCPVLYYVVPCCLSVLRSAGHSFLCYAVLCCAVLCCVMLCYAASCCAALCCVVVWLHIVLALLCLDTDFSGALLYQVGLLLSFGLESPCCLCHRSSTMRGLS